MTARLAPIAPVLAALERWRPVYVRWWDHPCRRGPAEPACDVGASGDGAEGWAASARQWSTVEREWPAMQRPWSAEEQARLDRLARTDPDAMAAAADRFDAVAAELADIGRSAGAVGAQAAVGPGASASCTALAAVVESEVTEVTALAAELRVASTQAEAWLTELVRQVLRVGGGLVDGGAYRSALLLAQRDVDEADAVAAAVVNRYPGNDALALAEPAALARWARLDEVVGVQGAVLAVLRAGLAAAVDWTAPTAAADGWQTGSGSSPGPGPWAQTDADSGRGSGPDRSGGAGGWLSAGPAPVPDVVVDREYRDRVLRDWEPQRPASEQAPGAQPAVELPSRVPEQPAEAREVRPGIGPVLAGVEGHRTSTETGVRVAELPDGPASRTR